MVWSVVLLPALTLAPGPAAPEPLAALPRIEVIGTREAAERNPGSGQVLEGADLDSARVLTVNEALRKVPGVVVRDEEGFGLRPNIGIRGLNPTRSTKVLLLEDGIPAAYAPYGDNASYYHAPIERYEHVEVLKGVDMLRFGPQTIGGVINYVTPDPPDTLGGALRMAGGNRGGRTVQAELGGPGFLLDASWRAGDGNRDQLDLDQRDLNAKAQFAPGEHHTLVLRASLLREDSQITYSGITDAELRNFGRHYNPFGNDRFDIQRHGASLTHHWEVAERLSLTSNAYWFRFDRDWWRQASTTTDGQCGSAFTSARLAGQAVDVDACNSAQGRLRSYRTWGIEPRGRWQLDAAGTARLEFGLRHHRERQDRLQVNASSPTGRSGTLAESNLRHTEAQSGFVQGRFLWGRIELVPALRYEDVDNRRRNRLNSRVGAARLDAWIPGLGFIASLSDGWNLYGGVHRGFAPPRTEDLIDGNGGTVEVDAERSTNVELGLRGRLDAGGSVDLTAFRNDFSNQIAVGSIASGNTPLAEGQTLYEGLELAGRLEQLDGERVAGNLYAQAALTWLATARQDSAFVAVATGQTVAGSGAGRRMPYAPELLATLRVGLAAGPWDVSLEAQHVGGQFADFANTAVAPVNGNGQIGRIADHTLLHATLNWQPADLPFGVYLTLKNLTDRFYIADRTRGIQVGTPRLYQMGVDYRF